MISSFFRYPGGKAKLGNIIIDKILKYSDGIDTYHEPFIGGGSIFLNVLSKNHFKTIWINDRDYPLACLWNTIINNPEELKLKIKEFVPSVDWFLVNKEILNNEEYDKLLVNDTLEEEQLIIGFTKLAIHQLSYSGLGLKSGGPLGGISQNSKYKIDCRWSPEYICNKIDSIQNLLISTNIKFNSCTAYDFKDVLNNSINSFIYLDPPYYAKGNELYKYSFTIEDHLDLCSLLSETPSKWLLSYDSCNFIKELYSWASIEEINVNYTINGSLTKKELLITNVL